MNSDQKRQYAHPDTGSYCSRHRTIPYRRMPCSLIRLAVDWLLRVTMSALGQKQTFAVQIATSALCHVWTAPSPQELSSRLQHWSVQPCVRPVSAAHGAAGHNALRGSGPDHKHAFDLRWPRVVLIAGSPALHYALFALPPFTSRRRSDATSSTPKATDSLERSPLAIMAQTCHLVGECDGGDFGRPRCQQCRKPRPMLGAWNLA